MALDENTKHIDWDRLLTTAEWADTLRFLLSEATTVAGSQNTDDMDDLQDILRTYIKKSPPKVQHLDSIASGVIEDLMGADLNIRLAAIRSRNTDLKKQIDIIEGVTAEAKANAAELRLEPVIQQLNLARQSLEKLRQDYEAAGDTANSWYKKTQDLIASLSTFLA